VKEVNLQPFTEFQMHRLSQIDLAMRKISQAEDAMRHYGTDSVIVSGDYDHEEIMDREGLHGSKGGVSGMCNEVIFDVQQDEQTHKWTRTFNQEMKNVIDQMIFLNK